MDPGMPTGLSGVVTIPDRVKTIRRIILMFGCEKGDC